MVKKAPFSFQRYLKLSGHQKFTAHKYLDSFWLLTKTNDFQAFSPCFGPFWTSNCYIIIEYTENLIKPSDSLLKTVLDRVSALVPEFKIDQNMLFLSLTSFTTKQAEQHSKIQSILQFRAIWHILTLVNKFSSYPLHGKAINGKAQIFETLRLWRPLEQREYAASQELPPEYSHL